jgi:hypothetical protein
MQEYATYIYGALLILGVLTVIYIINSNGNPDFKVTWMLLIMITPIIGSVFYLFVKTQPGTAYISKRLKELQKETKAYMLQDKKVLEVESGMQQYEMFANFSQELQILLLETNLDYTVAEYGAELQELYDLWCAGDEAALRTALAEEDNELIAEEPVYQEYVDKVIIQRNEGMLDVAVEYLESGETVFYAVGIAHLLQENGLVDTLRTAGYTVEQVSYS